MKLEWDAVGKRFYETGVSKCVLYLQDKTGSYPEGVAWNGITGISESPSGAEASDIYADNIKYATLRSAELFGATIEAYTSPDEWDLCDGMVEPVKGVKVGQQNRNSFGLCYRTEVGNDTSTEEDDGYKLHFIYGATASPSSKDYKTVNESPEALSFSWEISTTPVSVTGLKPTSYISISSLDTTEDRMKELEDIIYGSDDEEARLPLPDEIISILKGENTPTPEVIPEG